MAYDLQTNNLANIRQSLDSMMKELSVHDDLPLFKSLGMLSNGEGVTNTTHNWPDLIMPGRRTTLNTTINNSTTTVVVDNTYKNLTPVWSVGQTFRIYDTTDPHVFEEFSVSAVSVGGSTTTLTVATRPFTSVSAASTAAAATGGTALVVLGDILEGEGEDVSVFRNTKSIQRSNYVQIFKEPFRVTYTSEAVDDVAKDGKITEQERRALKISMKRLHQTAIYGSKAKFTNSNGNEVRMMGGIDNFIPAANKVNEAGAALSSAIIDGIAIQIKELGGMADTILCSYKQKVKIDALKAAKVTQGGMSQSEHNLDNLVDTYDSNAGVLKVIPCNDIKDDEIFIFNSADFMVRPMVGLSYQTKPLPDNGSGPKGFVYGEYTQVAHLPEVAFRLYNLSVS